LLHVLAQRSHRDLLVDNLSAQLGRVGLLLQHRLQLDDVGLQLAYFGLQLTGLTEFLAATACQLTRAMSGT
jgi:hypothetical protein